MQEKDVSAPLLSALRSFLLLCPKCYMACVELCFGFS